MFIADPHALFHWLPSFAGVGNSALYRRYRGQEELLRRLCSDGLDRYISEVEAALADGADL